MNAIPPTNMAIRYTRMLLIKTGLREAEADQLIERIAAEASAYGVTDESERLAFIEHELDKLKSVKSGRLSRDLIIGTIGGVVGNYVTREIDKIVIHPEPPSPPISPPVNHRAIPTIRAEWAGCNPDVIPDFRGHWTWALKVHERRGGPVNLMAAFYYDGISMLMDLHGDHRQAEPIRRQVVKISQKLNGATHESTAAALSNLGLCLHARGKEVENARYLVRSLRILLEYPTTNQLSISAVIYNIYYFWGNNPHFLHAKISPEFRRSLPEFKKFGQGMMALKALLIALSSLLDLLQTLQVAFQER